MKAANETLKARKKELEEQLDSNPMNLNATHVALAELKQVNESLNLVKDLSKKGKEQEPPKE